MAAVAREYWARIGHADKSVFDYKSRNGATRASRMSIPQASAKDTVMEGGPANPGRSAAVQHPRVRMAMNRRQRP